MEPMSRRTNVSICTNKPHNSCQHIYSLNYILKKIMLLKKRNFFFLKKNPWSKKKRRANEVTKSVLDWTYQFLLSWFLPNQQLPPFMTVLIKYTPCCDHFALSSYRLKANKELPPFPSCHQCPFHLFCFQNGPYSLSQAFNLSPHLQLTYLCNFNFVPSQVSSNLMLVDKIELGQIKTNKNMSYNIFIWS